MDPLLLRDATAADFARIVQLNADEVAFTSAMDLDRLRALHAMAALHRVAERDGAVVGFLLAFTDSAAYDGANYRWFAQHYPRFLYVDRIVVDRAAARGGVGRRLYEDLFAHARRLGIGRVTCEYDIDPPNPASRAFHERFGFLEVGTRITDGGKRVSLQAATA